MEEWLIFKNSSLDSSLNPTSMWLCASVIEEGFSTVIHESYIIHNTSTGNITTYYYHNDPLFIVTCK